MLNVILHFQNFLNIYKFLHSIGSIDLKWITQYSDLRQSPVCQCKLRSIVRKYLTVIVNIATEETNQ